MSENVSAPTNPLRPKPMSRPLWLALMGVGGLVLALLVAGLVDFTLARLMIDDPDIRELRRRFVVIGALADLEPALQQQHGLDGQLGYICNVNVVFGVIRGYACDIALSKDGHAATVSLVPPALREELIARHPLPAALVAEGGHVRPWPTMNR